MIRHNLVSMSRRRFLGSVAAFATVAGLSPAFGRTFSGILPWAPNVAEPPMPVMPGGWTFFTPAEVATMEAIVDRLVPADDLSIGGREAGCVTYIDRQLSSYYGKSSRLYMQPPFMKALPTQGYQSSQTPADRYRAGLAAIDKYLKGNGGKGFAELSPEEQDKFLSDLEGKKVELPDGVSAPGFFGLMLQNTMEGFFGDPVYGGNKDMASWKMLGFPGARYDYRDHVAKHNEPYPNPPVSILGRVEWNEKRA